MMSRRVFLTVSVAICVMAGSAMAQNDPVTRSVIGQLEQQGFGITDLRRTLLGRVRITAQRGSLTRELVFDPRNGAILRDFVSEDDVAVRIPDIGDYDDNGNLDDDDDDGADDDGGDDNDDGGDDDDDDDDGDDGGDDDDDGGDDDGGDDDDDD